MKFTHIIPLLITSALAEYTVNHSLEGPSQRIELKTLNPRNLDESAVYYIRDTNSYLVHESKLNVLGRASGVGLLAANSGNTWMEFLQPDGVVEAMSSRKALTGCLDVTQGSGGGLSGGVARSIGASLGVDLAVGFNLQMANLGLKGGAAIGASVSVQFSYNCGFDKGSVGQVQIDVPYLELIGGKFRKVRLEKVKGLFRDKVMLHKGEWETPESPVRLASLDRPPVIHCVTDPEQLMCKSRVVGMASLLMD